MILLISEKLEHYRIPLYNSLVSNIDLTVIHKDSKLANCKFKQKKLDIIKFNGLNYYKLKTLNEYDYVIYPFNIRVINLALELMKLKRNYKIGVFGIGVSASYTKSYDKKTALNLLRKLYLKKFDFGIFYENYPFIKYTSAGVNPKKLSVAYNTVLPNPNFDFNQKKYLSFLFIGSLYKEKKIFELLHAYLYLYLNNSSIYF